MTNPPPDSDPTGPLDRSGTASSSGTRSSSGTGSDERDEKLICSAKDCRLPATYALLWNNPKLHTPDRRKTWLACDDHRESLATFLDVRGFLRDVAPL